MMVGKFKLRAGNEVYMKNLGWFFFAYRCPLFEFYTRTPTFIVVETLKDVSTYNYTANVLTIKTMDFDRVPNPHKC